MSALRPTTVIFCVVLLVACTKEMPPRTVTEFMDDQILLEAALLRCTENRAESRYIAECVNAREAVKLLAAKNEKAKEAELEALSERKREALRRTQQAASEARRRAAELEKRREELEYQAQFGIPMPTDSADYTGTAPLSAAGSNVPVAVVPAPPGGTEQAFPGQAFPGQATVTEGAVAQGMPGEPEGQAMPDPAADLGTIREELRRRNASPPQDVPASQDSGDGAGSVNAVDTAVDTTDGNSTDDPTAETTADATD